MNEINVYCVFNMYHSFIPSYFKKEKNICKGRTRATVKFNKSDGIKKKVVGEGQQYPGWLSRQDKH